MDETLVELGVGGGELALLPVGDRGGGSREHVDNN